MKKPLLLIIRGYSGTGKTTIMKELSKKYNLNSVEYDMYIYGLKWNHKNLDEKDWDISMKTMMKQLETCIQHKKNIILEGSLVSVENNKPFDLNNILTLAKRNNYRLLSILLTNNWKKSSERTKKRGTYVKRDLYEKMKQKIHTFSLPKEIIINTDNLSLKETTKLLERELKKLL